MSDYIESEFVDEYQTDSAIKEHSDVHGSDIVNVLLPLKLYEMTIKHRVLAELGELSHFILSVMGKYDLTVQDIEEVTRLSEIQIRPVVDRMKALKFISDSESVLTETGKRAAFILEYIHNKQVPLYIDQNYASRNNNHDWFIAVEGENSLREISKRCFIVPLPQNARFNPIEDCFKQSQRFQNNYFEILPNILPEFNQILDDSNATWKQEWDVGFRSHACDKSMGIPIDLELKNFVEAKEKSNEKTLRLYTELLRLKVKFSLPKGIDFKEFENIKPKNFIYSDNDQRIYDYIDFEVEVDEDKRLYSEGLFNEKESALDLLAHSIAFIDEDAQLYSRENSFDKGWQLHEYSYEEVIGSIKNPGIIRIKA
ncbi:hypothetical protein AMS58_03195 [Pseudoalteromonas porphyrae]|uniref:Uncharacterized protein n=1 Tax=Pseudoalteromonas porphyrae TaxID=187330 RepID=A0A0N0M0N4_9GAMM|nr:MULTISPECIES: hypothetical protein [Pseudoalteromonas]KPH64268.1 hypothetical protein ADS77_06160 [Pseudoalteromonas porphyrae]KPH96100.1 hypothetical protein AMS58_03195 [Pseudoalteromonas porphyrae]